MKTKKHYTEQLENIGYTVSDLTTSNDICGVLLATWEHQAGIGYMLYLPNSKYNSPSEEKFNKIGVCVVDADTLEPLDGEGIYLDHYTEIEDFHKRVLNR
jgi:benzoyl-CoA reductase/2-hydroxyglutaryl-CoA dehydratase subunit BcrC/BadD/HgdB